MNSIINIDDLRKKKDEQDIKEIEKFIYQEWDKWTVEIKEIDNLPRKTIEDLKRKRFIDLSELEGVNIHIPSKLKSFKAIHTVYKDKKRMSFNKLKELDCFAFKLNKQARVFKEIDNIDVFTING